MNDLSLNTKGNAQGGAFSKPVIDVRGLVKSYKDRKALRGISFQVEEGECFGFLGPNGAGKTTTIRILTGQSLPSGGEAHIMGRHVVRERAQIQPALGVMPDKTNLYERLTVQQNLAFYCRLYGVDPRRIPELLARVGLEKESRTPVKRLSRGMKQRVLLVRSLLHRPRILFLDEPTSGLDPATAGQIHRLLAELNAEGMTIFLTSHNMEEVDRLCHRVAFLDQGEIAEMGSPADLKLKHATDEVKVLVETDAGALEPHTLPLRGEESAGRIAQWMREGRLRSIHSKEPTLADIFIKLTGKELV